MGIQPRGYSTKAFIYSIFAREWGSTYKKVGTVNALHTTCSYISKTKEWVC